MPDILRNSRQKSRLLMAFYRKGLGRFRSTKRVEEAAAQSKHKRRAHRGRLDETQGANVATFLSLLLDALDAPEETVPPFDTHDPP
jgi:hypothetical protein